MPRGFFIRGDGLVIPNNVSIAGAQWLLGAALNSDVSPVDSYIGLCQGQPSPTMTIADVREPNHPSDAVAPYARQHLTRDQTGWPVIGIDGTDAYAESRFVEFAAPATPYNIAIQRVMLTNHSAASNAPIYAMSEALPDPIILGPDTPQSLRRFKYRLYI